MTKLTQPFNDRAIRLFGVPLLGIIIPNVTGLITNYRYTFIQLVGCYAYFTIVSLVIWVGNVRLMYAIREKYFWRYSSYYKIVTLIFSANIFYSGIVSVAMLYVWSLVSNEMTHNWQPVYFAVVIIIISVLFITSLYENMFLNQERISNLSTVEQLNAAKVQAELEALKNQIDPHFIFNSLNTLSFLITKDPRSAKLYNDTLAKVYRYILSNK
ncbi:MAG: histidine kinase, partial [Ginsengibacter sp.]